MFLSSTHAHVSSQMHIVCLYLDNEAKTVPNFHCYCVSVSEWCDANTLIQSVNPAAPEVEMKSAPLVVLMSKQRFNKLKKEQEKNVSGKRHTLITGRHSHIKQTATRAGNGLQCCLLLCWVGSADHSRDTPWLSYSLRPTERETRSTDRLLVKRKFTALNMMRWKSQPAHFQHESTHRNKNQHWYKLIACYSFSRQKIQNIEANYCINVTWSAYKMSAPPINTNVKMLTHLGQS